MNPERNRHPKKPEKRSMLNKIGNFFAAGAALISVNASEPANAENSSRGSKVEHYEKSEYKPIKEFQKKIRTEQNINNTEQNINSDESDGDAETDLVDAQLANNVVTKTEEEKKEEDRRNKWIAKVHKKIEEIKDWRYNINGNYFNPPKVYESNTAADLLEYNIMVSEFFDILGKNPKKRLKGTKEVEPVYGFLDFEKSDPELYASFTDIDVNKKYRDEFTQDNFEILFYIKLIASLNIEQASDKEIYGVEEKWKIPTIAKPNTGTSSENSQASVTINKGDCEDFVLLWKRASQLQDFDPRNSHIITATELKKNEDGSFVFDSENNVVRDGHALLGQDFKLEDGTVITVILDIKKKRIYTLDELLSGGEYSSISFSKPVLKMINGKPQYILKFFRYEE